MICRNSLALLALALITLPASVNAGSAEKIRNQQVVVTEETLAPGETASLSADRPSMRVYVTDGVEELTSVNRIAHKLLVKRGSITFHRGEKESIKNDGSSKLTFVCVEFLNKANPETWGMTALAPNYKMLLENEYARAYDIKIPAQTFEPQHTHHDRVVICLAGAELEHILPNGEKQPSTLKTGEIGWRLGATHIGHNMGHTDLWVIAIEPK
jgi:quercetin dioxygenase-like cupin family protein